MFSRALALWERSLDLREQELKLQRELLQQLPLLTKEAFATSQIMATASAEQSKALATYFSALASGYQAYAQPQQPQKSSPFANGANVADGPASDELIASLYAQFIEGEDSAYAFGP